MKLVEALRARARQTIAPLIAPGRRVALVDFPNHSNVGDSAIWSGEIALLRELGVGMPSYVCFGETYHRAFMARAIGPDGVILLHGGGNFGDLWPWHQALRELVVRDFPKHEIIQLPQTVYFENGAALARARAVFDRHSKLTILARSEKSLEFVRRSFKARAFLAPDSAFFINPPELNVSPDIDVIWLSRTDRETAGRTGIQAAGVQRLDWLDDHPSPALTKDRLLRRMMLYMPRIVRGALSSQWSPEFCEALAWERVVRGMRLLRRGRAVITDRLHGHILCELLGIPHVMLANSYPKIREFRETWTATSRLAHWSDSDADAIRLALELAHGAE